MSKKETVTPPNARSVAETERLDNKFFGQEDTKPFPSDIQWVKDWHFRLDTWCKNDIPPNAYARGIFLPDRSAINALMRISFKFGEPVAQVRRAYEACDELIENLPTSQQAADDLAESMYRLLGVLNTFIEAVEESQKTPIIGDDMPNSMPANDAQVDRKTKNPSPSKEAIRNGTTGNGDRFIDMDENDDQPDWTSTIDKADLRDVLEKPKHEWTKWQARLIKKGALRLSDDSRSKSVERANKIQVNLSAIDAKDAAKLRKFLDP